VLYRVEELDKWAALWYNVLLPEKGKFGRELLENLEYSDNLPPAKSLNNLITCRKKITGKFFQLIILKDLLAA